MVSVSEGQVWRRKTDNSKILAVCWTSTCGYVQFFAPWMKKNLPVCKVKTFLKRYERMS